jgi:hypothetical protein
MKGKYLFVILFCLFFIFCNRQKEINKVSKEELKQEQLEENVYNKLYPLLTKVEGNPVFEAPPKDLNVTSKEYDEWMKKNAKDCEEYDRKQIKKVANELDLSYEQTEEIYYRKAKEKLREKLKR